MGYFSAGQVVFLPFPFSDLSRRKLRPVLILAGAGRQDWIVCEITINPFSDDYAIALTQDAFSSGGLKRVSYVRPNKLFTADESLIASSAGTLTQAAFGLFRNAVMAIFLNDPVVTE